MEKRQYVGTKSAFTSSSYISNFIFHLPVLEFIIFFNGVFMLNFLGLWIWFLGYEFYLLEVSLLIERWENLGLSWDFVYLGFVVWENLLLGLCLCSCWRLICVCVWLTRKGKKNARKSGHVFSCFKSGSVFFGVLVEDELRSGQLIFFLLLKLKNKYFKL